MRVIDSDGTVKYAQVVDTPGGDDEGEDSDDESFVDLMDVEVKPAAPNTGPSVVAESEGVKKSGSGGGSAGDDDAGDDEEDGEEIEVVDGPGTEERNRLDEEGQRKKVSDGKPLSIRQ